MMVEKRASDLYITAGLAPSLRIQGRSVAVDNQSLTPQKTRELVLSVLNEEQRAEYTKNKECNFAITAPNLGRFRVSAFQQRNYSGMVVRRIESYIPTPEELGLPEIVKELALAARGLVILVGATGTGKSSSMAAMLGYRNRYGAGHIITIEDPIEFVHPHDGCIVTQREVGLDTESFEVALKNSFRQAPDVVEIGEIRTAETMDYALEFAETGHLCIATLHANNAHQALDRIQHFFPQDRQAQVWTSLSLNLKAIMAQQLVPLVDGKNLVLATEVLVNTPIVADKIREGNVTELKEYMSRTNHVGMRTFDQSLYELYSQGKITEETALKYADSSNNVRLLIKLAEEKIKEAGKSTQTLTLARRGKLDDDE